MKIFLTFGLALLLAPLAPLHAADSTPPTASADDAAWLRARGTLIFHDAFEREEDGNLAKAIGNGWNRATADHVHPNASGAEKMAARWFATLSPLLVSNAAAAPR